MSVSKKMEVGIVWVHICESVHCMFLNIDVFQTVSKQIGGTKDEVHNQSGYFKQVA